MDEEIFADDDGTEAVCPYCKQRWQDLWEYDWSSRETIEVECPFCRKKLKLSQYVSVSYSTRAISSNDKSEE